ncbi:MAG: hypothetical protein GX992_01620 [Clostridium sp.]|nr:hypothetical protein [Clostridium sp.]
MGELPFVEALPFAKAMLACEPDDDKYIYPYLSFLDKDDAIEFLKTRLDERPILVNWHRVYQTYMETFRSSHDLEEEYSGYLKKESGNNALHYLLSRILTDPKRAKELLLKSIKGNEPCPYGYYGLAYQELSDGDFEQALYYAKKAVEASPKHETFNYILEAAMLAQKEYMPLVEKKRLEQEMYPYNGELVEQEICLLCGLGDIEGAKEAISKYVEFLKSEDEETAAVWDTYLKGVIAYCLGDLAEYGASIREIDNPFYAFENAFINKKFNDAFQIADENNLVGLYYLLLYLAQNNPGSDVLETAIDMYKAGDATDRLVADYLSGKKDFVLDDVKSIVILPQEKCVIMATFGKLYEEYQEELYAFARKLNYGTSFPSYFIDEITSKGEAW